MIRSVSGTPVQVRAGEKYLIGRYGVVCAIERHEDGSYPATPCLVRFPDSQQIYRFHWRQLTPDQRKWRILAKLEATAENAPPDYTEEMQGALLDAALHCAELSTTYARFAILEPLANGKLKLVRRWERGACWDLE